MFRFISEKIKTIIVTLRFSILSIFVSLFITVVLTLVGISYYRASETMLFTANKLMDKITQKIIDDISNRILWSQDAADLSAELIEANIIRANHDPIFIDYFFTLINRLVLAQAIYWGDEEGDFVIMEREPDGRISVRIIDKKASINTVYYYKDINHRKIIETNTANPINYDPRKREWYQLAKAQRHNIWTDIYTFAFNKQLGITTASPAYNSDNQLLGVFGIDIRLDFLSRFIATETFSQNGIPFIVTSGGKVIAIPEKNGETEHLFKDIHHINQPWLAKSFDIYKKNHEHRFVFYYQGQAYLANYTMVTHFDLTDDWFVALVVPESDFIAELKKASIIDTIIGFLILGLGIIFVSYLITRIVNPIKMLVKNTEKIKNLHLSSSYRVHSRIKEVLLLSNAIEAMRTGLQSFQKYVPATLVRQLIKTGEYAHIGGTKKKLAVLFSDIKDFTTISESMNPNQLMEYICLYFNEISHIITLEGGTIDKYIGDSVMAFWGAPLNMKDPCQHAAAAALQCVNRMKEFNKKWQNKGFSELYTRIGLHTGEAIVGNVGSNERLNYTALGDTINVASRLENLNKLYGTQIIASEDMYKVIKNQFVLRRLDKVQVRGKTTITYIYELLAKTRKEVTFNLEVYCQTFDLAFSDYENGHWENAIEKFKQCLIIYPEDTVAQAFIQRCLLFKEKPPHYWNGVWHHNLI